MRLRFQIQKQEPDNLSGDDLVDSALGTSYTSGGLSGLSDDEYSTSLHASKSFTSLQDSDVEFKREQIGDYLRGQLLGHGSFGAVYEAYCMSTRRVVALKVCSGKRRKTLSNATYAIDQVDTEIRILKSLPRNLFVINFLESFPSSDASICVAYDIVEGQNLHSLVSISSKSGLVDSQVQHVLYSLLQALKHLKKHGILHGDIKPENVLISSAHSVVLSDFGCACAIDECDAERMREAGKLSPAFQAPEIADFDFDFFSAEISADWFSVEMWSVGIVLFFASSGNYPFNSNDGLLDLIDQITQINVDFDQIQNPELLNLLQKLFARMDVRLNLAQCLECTFLSDFDFESSADRSLWTNPTKADSTFVNGVQPSSYQIKGKKSRRKKSAETSSDNYTLPKKNSGLAQSSSAPPALYYTNTTSSTSGEEASSMNPSPNSPSRPAKQCQIL